MSLILPYYCSQLSTLWNNLDEDGKDVWRQRASEENDRRLERNLVVLKKYMASLENKEDDDEDTFAFSSDDDDENEKMMTNAKLRRETKGKGKL